MAKEYIEREAVIAVLWYNQDECGSAIVSDIEAIPAADAREVVTCAKCRYYSEKRKECGHVNGLSELVFPTDYCSYGSIMREVDDDD